MISKTIAPSFRSCRKWQIPGGGRNRGGGWLTCSDLRQNHDRARQPRDEGTRDASESSQDPTSGIRVPKAPSPHATEGPPQSAPSSLGQGHLPAQSTRRLASNKTHTKGKSRISTVVYSSLSAIKDFSQPVSFSRKSASYDRNSFYLVATPTKIYLFFLGTIGLITESIKPRSFRCFSVLPKVPKNPNVWNSILLYSLNNASIS